MEITHIIVYYLISVNVLTFLAFGIDKWKAVHNGPNNRHLPRRIPEASLLFLALLGGSPAALLAMLLFRHKTQHKKFRYGVPAILLVQVTIVIVLIRIYASGT